MTASVQSNHFNLHVNGVGYLNRVRWVEPKRNAGRRADPFLACSIAALRGNSDQPDYTYLDLRVSGREAIEMVDRLREDVAAERNVFISFRVGDIYPHLYERDVKDRQTGRKTGEREMAALIKGRLLLINSITIDGENVFRRDPDAAAPEDDTPAANSEEYDHEQGDGPALEPQVQPRPAQGPSARRGKTIVRASAVDAADGRWCGTAVVPWVRVNACHRTSVANFAISSGVWNACTRQVFLCQLA